jgi:hypothetical protein
MPLAGLPHANKYDQKDSPAEKEMRVRTREHVRNEGSRRFKSAPLRQRVGYLPVVSNRRHIDRLRHRRELQQPARLTSVRSTTAKTPMGGGPLAEEARPPVISLIAFTKSSSSVAITYWAPSSMSSVFWNQRCTTRRRDRRRGHRLAES